MGTIKHKRGEPSALSTECKALAGQSDTDIDYGDTPACGDEQWSEGVRGKSYRPLKKK